MDRITSEQFFWDRFAGKYDHFIKKQCGTEYRRMKKLLAVDTANTKQLLEIATGTGIHALELRKQVPRITAIDISPEMILIAREKDLAQNGTSTVDFRVGDACHLDFPDWNFDMVLASNMLHLLQEPEQALVEMKRVLVPKGKVILPTYCHGKSLYTKSLSMMSGLIGFKVSNRWSVRDYWTFVEHMGFRILKLEVLDNTFPLVYLLAENNTKIIQTK